MTHTFAALAVSAAAHAEIAELLRKAGYDHAVRDDVIDMNGIGLMVTPLQAGPGLNRAAEEAALELLSHLMHDDIKPDTEVGQAMTRLARAIEIYEKVVYPFASHMSDERQHHAALQRIGHALGLPPGADLHADCVPEIERLTAAARTLDRKGYTHTGSVEWRPPRGPYPTFLNEQGGARSIDAADRPQYLLDPTGAGEMEVWDESLRRYRRLTAEEHVAFRAKTRQEGIAAATAPLQPRTPEPSDADEPTARQYRRAHAQMTSVLMECEEKLSNLGVGMSVGKRDALVGRIRKALAPFAQDNHAAQPRTLDAPADHIAAVSNMVFERTLDTSELDEFIAWAENMGEDTTESERADRWFVSDRTEFAYLALTEVPRLAAGRAATPVARKPEHPVGASDSFGPDAAGCCNATVFQRCKGCPHDAATPAEQETLASAQRLIAQARGRGEVVTISLVPNPPLRMGGFDMVADVRKARGS